MCGLFFKLTEIFRLFLAKNPKFDKLDWEDTPPTEHLLGFLVHSKNRPMRNGSAGKDCPRLQQRDLDKLPYEHELMIKITKYGEEALSKTRVSRKGSTANFFFSLKTW